MLKISKNKARLIFYPLALAALALFLYSNGLVESFINKSTRRYTVASRLQELEPKIDAQLKPLFEKANVTYPPAAVTLVFIKDEKTLNLYAGPSENREQLIKTYPVKAASGHPGPKLREGDNQVPEGMYKVESLNPNSSFHLALRVNYPNAEDRRHAEAEGRQNPGGDIMIHGSSVSIGCIAIGDAAIEEVFILAAKTNYSQWQLILTPTDFGKKSPQANTEPQWLSGVYKEMQTRLARLEAIK